MERIFAVLLLPNTHSLLRKTSNGHNCCYPSSNLSLLFFDYYFITISTSCVACPYQSHQFATWSPWRGRQSQKRSLPKRPLIGKPHFVELFSNVFRSCQVGISLKYAFSICIFCQGRPLSISPWSLMIFGRSDRFLWSLLFVSSLFLALWDLYFYVSLQIVGRRIKVIHGICQ